MRLIHAQGLACAAALLLLAGCATRPVAPATGAGQVPDPSQLTDWSARGRLAVAANGEGGSGTFTWEQAGAETQLRLRGPLGAGGLDIATDGTTLRVQDAAGRAVDGDAARAALEQQLGVALPLAELRYWLLGVPAPGSSSTPAPATGNGVGGFDQGGWSIRLEQTTATGRWLVPQRLTASTATVRVRLVIDDWRLQ
jgi:outer membrane lipoprotein LolB